VQRVGPTGIVDAGIRSITQMTRAMMRAHAEYWSGAVDRKAHPADVGADVLRWFSTAARRERPAWASPHTVVARWPLARLRDFSGDDQNCAVAPTLLLPPQAGHDSCIVDFAPGQSQIQTVRAAGLRRVWSLDWIGATQDTRDAGIEDYIALLDAATDHTGWPVNLIGDCQGGWLAAIYAALRPERVNTLTIAGAPIDFHAGEALIHDWVRLLGTAPELAFYRSLVAANGGVAPGWALLAGFIAMQPEAELERQLQLLVNVRDEAHVARYQAFENWFKYTQPLPGAFYLWIVKHLFQRNELIHGRLRVDGVPVDLARITCPLYLLAGKADHITPPDQVFALAQAAGTPPDQITQTLAEGGHLGLFMGHDALATQWPAILTQVQTHSLK
jgi:poly(3-hydroxyalkanoate) synthetase